MLSNSISSAATRGNALSHGAIAYCNVCSARPRAGAREVVLRRRLSTRECHNSLTDLKYYRYSINLSLLCLFYYRFQHCQPGELLPAATGSGTGSPGGAAAAGGYFDPDSEVRVPGRRGDFKLNFQVEKSLRVAARR